MASLALTSQALFTKKNNNKWKSVCIAKNVTISISVTKPLQPPDSESHSLLVD